MTTRMLIDGLYAEETRVVIADEDNLLEFDIETSSKKQTKGNVYLAKVTRVEPSLQAAFVEYGSGRQGFLPFSEIHPDYYQIPVADKLALLAEYNKEEKAEAEAEEKAEEEKDAKDSGEEGQAEEGVEDLGSDVPYEEPPRRAKVRRYKIQEVVKKNQVILMQVIKEERGNKGASVTSYISIPGRYCVLMPNSTKGGGVSRKIGDNKERKRLKEALAGLKINDGMSIILRTAGMGRTKAEINRDYNYLIRLWNEIREQTLSSVAPAVVYEEAHAIKRGLRDLYNNDISEVIVSGEESYKTARDFMKMIMPSHVKKVTHYDSPKPIFNKYDVERHLMSMNDPVVMMPSGGYLVINSTEALISVDVNSGRSTGERNVEDMATSTNIEAAEEVARQLRLRDLAGLVVIDFIDMLRVGHRRQVERALKDALKSDRAKIQVGRISPFGLLEMSRQRLRPSLTEINMVECSACKGTGHTRIPESASVQLIRMVENELSEQPDKYKKISVTVSPALALYFLNTQRPRISELENEYNFQLVVGTEEMSPDSFKIQFEDENGNKSKAISSEDRGDLRLPKSRDGGKGKRKRSGNKNKRNRNRNDRNKNNNDRNDNENSKDDSNKDSQNNSQNNSQKDNQTESQNENNNENRNENRNHSNEQNKSESGKNDDKQDTQKDSGAEKPAESNEDKKPVKPKKPTSKRLPGKKPAPRAAKKSEATNAAPEKEVTEDVVVLDKEKPTKKPRSKPTKAVKPKKEDKAEKSDAAAVIAEPKNDNATIPADIVPEDKRQTKGWWKKIID